jgi:nucleoside-diphosphate kinase
MYQASLGILKRPEGYENKEEILWMVRQSGLEIPYIRAPYIMTKDKAKEHYSLFKDKPFYQELIDFWMGMETALFVVCGDEAVGRFYKLCGNTDPERAEEGTIRKRFGKDIEHNVLIRSDSPEYAKSHIRIHLPKKDILELPKNARDFIYGPRIVDM